MMKFFLCAMAMFCCLSVGFLRAQDDQKTTPVRCMIQMTNYNGEGAYIVISVVDSLDTYRETLHVLGDDPDWYYEIDEWWSYFGRKKRNIDGMTGATLSDGMREVINLNVPEYAIREGHTLRFETAVEDQPYYPAEIEVVLSDSLPPGKLEGAGYIRYIRLMQPN